MIEQDGVIRLAKPKRKGILSLIFSRFFIIALLILVEIALILIPLFLLEGFFQHFLATISIFTLIMLVYLFNSKMDSTAKLTWMFVIAVFQIAGALMRTASACSIVFAVKVSIAPWKRSSSASISATSFATYSSFCSTISITLPML